MYFPGQHFYVREYLDWCVCEQDSSFCLHFSTKYRAQFVRDLFMKWLCRHEFSRLIAAFVFFKYHSSSDTEWSCIRAKLVYIDKIPYQSI